VTDLTKKSAEELAELFVSHHLAALEAYRSRDIPAHNRSALRAEAAADALVAKGKIGQAKLEQLLRHPSPTVRLNAAAYVMDWAPNEAIPAIEKVMLWADDDRTERLFGESMIVGMDSETLLAEHYDLDILDVRNFIRAKYGLPPKENSIEEL
jgi:HEAT repeat protein